MIDIDELLNIAENDDRIVDVREISDDMYDIVCENKKIANQVANMLSARLGTIAFGFMKTNGGYYRFTIVSNNYDEKKSLKEKKYDWEKGEIVGFRGFPMNEYRVLEVLDEVAPKLKKNYEYEHKIDELFDEYEVLYIGSTTINGKWDEFEYVIIKNVHNGKIHVTTPEELSLPNGHKKSLKESFLDVDEMLVADVVDYFIFDCKFNKKDVEKVIYKNHKLNDFDTLTIKEIIDIQNELE